MANKRSKPDEIVTTVRKPEVPRKPGMPRLDEIHRIGVTTQTL